MLRLKTPKLLAVLALLLGLTVTAGIPAPVDASTQVMHEDFQVCESVQRNLESGGARTGILSMTREPGTVYFQQLVRAAIEAEVER